MAELQHCLGARQSTPLRVALVPHPANRFAGARSVQAVLRFQEDCVRAEYAIEGEIEQIAFPRLEPSERRDELWKRTCFELFIGQGDGYCEFNFSPSSEWAAYRFDSYRAGMRPLSSSPPKIRTAARPTQYSLHAEIPLDGFSGFDVRPIKIGLSAVIRSIGGETEFWGLAHPNGAPDFHDASCFTLQIS